MAKGNLKRKQVQQEMEYSPGPRPIVTLLILLGCILLLGMIFAAIKVFLLERTSSGVIQENGTIEVYFCQTENCTSAMLGAIDYASKIECAFYELNYPPIINALATKNTHVLVDEDNAHEVVGLAVEVVPSVGLMHDKFCVIDNRVVVTGSMNPTINDVERNDNNLVIISSPSIAARYTQEFEELRARTDRTYEKLPPRPHTVNISGVLVEQRFCPQEECEQAIIRELGKAQSEISFMLFTYTSDPVGDAMMDAADRGVLVHGVVENRQGDTYSEHVRLLEYGLDARNDGNRYTMHHKVIVIDNRTVITGSYNPTASANQRNDENLLIIHSPEIAQRYANEFQRIMAAAR